MTVKHLVISGGGPSLFSIFGCARYLHELKEWNIDDIESIYSCSSGAWLGVCFCLLKVGLTFDEIEGYIVRRSWKNLLSNEVLNIHLAFQQKGLFDASTIAKSISPLLQTVDMRTDISLRELFEKTNISLTMYAVDINKRPLEKVAISHKTFPDIPLFTALTMTMGLPGLVTPSFLEDKCLIDGGLMANYPYYECKNETNANDGEVLGFKIKWDNRKLTIDSSSNFFTFLSHLMKMMALHIDNISNKIEANDETVDCVIPDVGGPAGWMDAFTNTEMREEFVKQGRISGEDFIACRLEKRLKTQPESHT